MILRLTIDLRDARQFQDMRNDNLFLRDYLQATSTNTYEFDSDEFGFGDEESEITINEITDLLDCEAIGYDKAILTR